MERRLNFSILLDEEEAKAMAQSKASKKSGSKSGKKKGRVREEARKETGASGKVAAGPEKAGAQPGKDSARPAQAANPKKSGRRSKRFSMDAVPEFAKRVAQPPPRGHKKGKKKKS